MEIPYKGDLQPNVAVDSLGSDQGQQERQHSTSPADQHKPATMLTTLWRWSPAIFMVSYFVFSISIYTLASREAIEVLWFLYLTVGTLLAGVALLESYDGLSLLRDARKKTAKTAQSGWKSDVGAPLVELIVEDTTGDGDDRVRALRETIIYPSDKLRITTLPDSGDDAGLSNYLSNMQDRQSGPLADFTAVFRASESPHPHAVKYAVERLVADKKADIIQSRSVLVWPFGLPRVQALYSSLASFQHDTAYGLTYPGRTVTWGLPLSHGSAIYCRTVALQSAARQLKNPSVRHNAPALALSAYSQDIKAAYDMSVITYTECPRTLSGCSHLQTQTAVEWVASFPYARLAFTKPRTFSTASEKSGTTTATRTFKQRVCIIFMLLLARLGSHAILQYFSLALALLFNEAPKSTAEFATLIFFPYHISIWLIVSGLICLLGTVAMAHKAASEYAPPGWAFPLLVLMYPFMTLGQAIIDVYAQAGVFLGAL